MATTNKAATAAPAGASITELDDDQAVVSNSDNAAATPAPVVGAASTGNRVMLNISQGEGQNGKEAVFLSLNGDSIHVPRGQWFNVDEKFVSVLEDAIQTVYDTDDQSMEPRSVPRLSYQVKPVPVAA